MDKLENHFRQIIEEIGEDSKRQGLVGTPKRAAEAFRFLTRGYGESVQDIVNNAIFDSNASEIIMVKNIELYSLCEHHLLPFIGKCHVGYIPSGKVIGVSKVARIVDCYARRLQIQENLTRQIAETIETCTGAVGVAVTIEAQHLCMMMRGVEKQNSIMTTSCVLGEFHEDPSTRAEFFSLINLR